ncbi:MAG: dTDP-3-amino-3,6-dideoxy-alpha-D-galactopyranose 3-N-acetyltransferase [bacterium ADurb.BinA186]|nr:MAG: dTDP-3-amino-3,6-dideoxy-alpha-D-galactopyranose 3-N-acetyltransferase [bacterium ADurb.BinA186]
MKLKIETLPVIIFKIITALRCYFESFFYSFSLCHAGAGLKVREHVKVSGSKNIYLGEKCYIGRNVELDAVSGELRIGNNVEIRDNVRIFAKKIIIGDHVTIGEGSFLNGFMEISSGAWISRNCDLTGKIRIERAILGPKTAIISGDHKRDPQTGEILMSGEGNGGMVVIEKGAWTGYGTIILKGVVIKNNMVVGAGSVVTKSFDEGDVVAGNPAKKINSRLSISKN